MSSPGVATLVKMLESLPEEDQQKISDRLRDQLQLIMEDLRWEQSFKNKSAQMAAETKRVEREIAEGKSEPMIVDEL